MKKYLILALLAACTRPIPCPPFCLPPLGTATPTAAPAPTTPTATPTPPPPIATPTPRPEPSPPAVEVRQLTSGRAVIEVDISAFKATPPLDYYAFFTGMWDASDRHAPALELSLRGLTSEPCLRMPCGPSALGLVVRESGDILHDGKEPNEHLHCGEGINYSRRLPIGPDAIFRVVVEWDSSGWSVLAPGGSAKLSKGSPRVGLGVAFFPLPSSRGIGWAREPWTLQDKGGKARLLSWEPAGEQGALAGCP